MISIICSSILILIILVTSILLSIVNEISTALSTKAATATQAQTIPKNPGIVAVDKFGIKEIYPTKPNGGREWFINTGSPLNDTSFSLSGGGEETSNASLANATSLNGQIIKQPDDSYQVYGVRKTGKYDFSIRMNVNTVDTGQCQLKLLILLQLSCRLSP